MTKIKKITYRGFQFNVHTGQWSIRSDDQDAVIKNAICRLTVDRRVYALSQADSLTVNLIGQNKVKNKKHWRLEVIARFQKPEFVWTIWFDVAESGISVRISSAIRNCGPTELILGDCDLWVVEHNVGGVLRIGALPERQRVFAFNGGLGTQLVKQLDADGGLHKSAYLQHIHDPQTQKTMLAGFVSFDRMQTYFQGRYDVRQKSVDCIGRCLFQDFSLQPGAVVASESLCVELADDPYGVLTSWSDRVAQRYQPRIWRKPPPVGWIGWSWDTKEIQELAVARNICAIRERLKGFGVDYLWISIANLKDGLPGNWLECNKESFPHGFRNTLKKIIHAGLKPGLWVGPYLINMAARAAFAANRANLFKDKNTGQPLPRGRWPWAYKAKDGQEPELYALDCSHPHSLEFLRQVFSVYRQWGIRYYMLDFLASGQAVGQADYHDKRIIRGPAIPRRGMLAIRKAAGPDTHLLTAAGSTLINIGAIDTMRIGMDYGEGRQLQPRFASYPATYMINGSYGSCGSPQDNCLQNTAAYFFTHRKLFLNGQNMLTVDHPVPRNEAEFSATLFGMTGSPIMFGDDMDRISADRLELIKKVLPRPADWPFPADLFKRVYPDDYSRVLVAPVRTNWGDWSVVAVFNLDERTATTEIAMSELNMPPEKKFRVWDFWNARYCGCVRDNFAVEVPPKSCRLLRLSKLTAQPSVLATDMHVRQGQLELRDVVWDKRAYVLRGTAIRPRGEIGNLYVAASPGWKLADYTDLFVAKDARDGVLVIRKQLDFRRGRADWSIPFKPLDAEEKMWQAKHKQKDKTAGKAVMEII